MASDSATPQSLVVFLVEAGTSTPELAVAAAPGVSLISYSGTSRQMDGNFVISNFVLGTSSVAVFSFNQRINITFVVLPSTAADQIWQGKLVGQHRVWLSDAMLAMANDSQVLIRDVGDGTSTLSRSVSVFPPLKQLQSASGQQLAPVADGVFARFDVQLTAPSQKTAVEYQLVTAAGPPRTIPLSGSGRAREPNATDWEGAAVYQISVTGGLASLLFGGLVFGYRRFVFIAVSISVWFPSLQAFPAETKARLIWWLTTWATPPGSTTARNC